MGDDDHFRGTCGGALDPRNTRMGVLRGHAEGVCLKKRTDQIEKTIIYGQNLINELKPPGQKRGVYSIQCEF